MWGPCVVGRFMWGPCVVRHFMWGPCVVRHFMWGPCVVRRFILCVVFFCLFVYLRLVSCVPNVVDVPVLSILGCSFYFLSSVFNTEEYMVIYNNLLFFPGSISSISNNF
jgi:hypothetical protein